MTAPIRKHPERKKTELEKDPLAVKIAPTTVGPTKPPRPLKQFTSPTAAAAADSLSMVVGSVQKGGPNP